jgi:glycyl-tRNA synthetase beta chain
LRLRFVLMPEFFIELYSEEIPARLQARAAEDLGRLTADALAAIAPSGIRTFFGPRRLALAAEVRAEVPAARTVERGPRITAPEQALAGFLRKHGATRDALRQEGEFYVLEKASPATRAAALIEASLPPMLWRFPWAKSMRWGGTSAFTWVRPLRRILCLLDGDPVPFRLATADDDGHGLRAGDETEGHRVHAPGAVRVKNLAGWLDTLRARNVIADAAERQALIGEGIAAVAAARGLTVVEDRGLLEEVAGLVEWPVALLGRIDDAYMDLPPEVMQVSMRVNQRYFALRGPDGGAAPWFAFAANVAAPDGGAAIVAGNERVLRARFSDARHFWDLDRRTRLADRVPALDRVTFQAELGSQGARARRLSALAASIAPLVGADAAVSARAALLAKADLASGMVGEFPELQGVMGGYYAAHDGEAADIATAIREHYSPKGAGDSVPRAPVAVAVALADKLDQLAGFFSIGQKPSGSGDPYALRRAALGVIRIVRENALRLPLTAALVPAAAPFGDKPGDLAGEVLAFIIERLRVQLRAEGARHDVLAAIFAAGADDDLVRALARTDAIAALLTTEDGANLLAAYRRAANILRIEDRKDGPHEGEVDVALLHLPAEQALNAALAGAAGADLLLAQEDFAGAMGVLAALRQPLDAFFDTVTVNADDPALRRNRLCLLAALRRAIDRVADFARIESP